LEGRLSITSRARCWAPILGGVILLGASPGRADSPSKLECVAANEAGQLLVQSGKPIEAERRLATCMAASCPVPLRQDCGQRLLEIHRVIPTIAFDWQDSAGEGLRPTRVTVDGQSSPYALEGEAIPLDPGEHRFSFEADGMSRVEKTFTLLEGQKGRRETIVFVSSAASAAAGDGQDGARRRPSRDEHPDAEAGPSRSSRVPTLAYVAGGLGIAGLGLGIAAGLTAGSHNSELQRECQGNVCPASARPDIDAFRTWRDWSTAGYILAGVGVTGGVVLWLMAPKTSPRDTAVELRIGPRSAGLTGSFW
jgi:hypothetical protein